MHNSAFHIGNPSTKTKKAPKKSGEPNTNKENDDEGGGADGDGDAHEDEQESEQEGEQEGEGEQEETEVKVKLNKKVHIPKGVFPHHKAPRCGYWVGKTCATNAGGTDDIGIHIEGEEIFTRPKTEVAGWIVV